MRFREFKKVFNRRVSACTTYFKLFRYCRIIM